MFTTEDDGTVVLRMTRADHDALLLNLGYAAGARRARGEPLEPALALLNRLEEGNPDFTPYSIPRKPRPTRYVIPQGEI